MYENRSCREQRLDGVSVLTCSVLKPLTWLCFLISNAVLVDPQVEAQSLACACESNSLKIPPTSALTALCMSAVNDWTFDARAPRCERLRTVAASL